MKQGLGRYYCDENGTVKRNSVTVGEAITKYDPNFYSKVQNYGEPTYKYERYSTNNANSNIATYPSDDYYISNINNPGIINNFIDYSTEMATDKKGQLAYTLGKNQYVHKILVVESDPANGYGVIQNQNTIHNGLAKVLTACDEDSGYSLYYPNKSFGSITIEKRDTTGKNEDDYSSEEEYIKDSPAFEGVKFKIYYYDNDGQKHYAADDFSNPKHTINTSVEEYLNSIGGDIESFDNNSTSNDDEDDDSEEGEQSNWYEIANKTMEEINKIIADNGDSRDNFTTDENLAYSFITNQDGIINVPYLPAGRTYYAVETGFTDEEMYDYFMVKDTEYEFDLTEPRSSQTKSVEVSKYIGNEQVLTSISGRIWEDIQVTKEAKRNDLFDEGIEDKDANGNPIDYSGVLVKLVVRGTENIVKDYYGNECVTTTNQNGEYRFGKLEINSLSDYAVMFEYNGLKYTNVLMKEEEDNGSKAEELVNPSYEDIGISVNRPNAREEFNKQYSIIENDKSLNGNTLTNNLSYNFNDHKSTLVEDLGYTTNSNGHVNSQLGSSGIAIKADTIKIDLYNHLKNYDGKRYKEVRNINLGLYEREQPTISVKKDIENIEVYINDVAHRYDYDQRFLNMGETGDGYDVGVKFGNKYGKMKYTRVIYKADAEWSLRTNESTWDGKDNELEAFITYKIGIKNQSTNLKIKVNSILDYFDKKYTWVEDPYELENGQKKYLSADLSNVNYNNDYNRIKIDTTSNPMEPESERIIYLRLKLTRDAISKILEVNENDAEGDLLDNVVEINSYSIFDENDAIYAGIDKESNPGNTNPNDKNTHENDTDTAPALHLVASEIRSIEGTVFLENTDENTKAGEKRTGNGMYDNDDTEVKNVKVSLMKIDRVTGEEKVAQYYNTSSKTWELAEMITSDNGNYRFEGFTPDEYIVRYTWGQEQGTIAQNGKEINVQDYKATEYNDERYGVNTQNNETATLWYKGQGKNAPEERYSDALDNYETRKQIDGEMTYIDIKSNYKTLENTENREMRSSTFKMKIPLEYNDTNQNATTEFIESGKLEYNIKNVDFGIIERARQKMETKKRVSSIKITLANGEVISDATIDEDGKISGERKHLTNILGDGKGSGFVKAELDNELIQGSTLQVGYTITVYNNSELDYATQAYYERGIKGTEDQKIKIRPTEIIDYLDNDWNFAKDDNPDWEAITYEELKTSSNSGDRSQILVDGSVIDLNDSDITNRIIVHTTSLQNRAISPASQDSVELKLSKILTISDDIQLNNETEVVKIVSGPPTITTTFPPMQPSYLPSDHTGRIITIIPGNYIPGKSNYEEDSGSAETVEVTPSTGENRDYVLPITIGLLALIMLGSGVVLIKKFVINKK